MLQTASEIFKSGREIVLVLAQAAVGFAFPFVGKLRKEIIHVDNETARIASVVAGIATAATILYTYSSRYSFYADVPFIRYWYAYIVAGILLVLFHYIIVEKTKENRISPWLGKRASVVSYTLIFVLLALGFNYKMFDVLYDYRAGKVAEACKTQVVNIEQDHSILNTIPLAWDRTFKAFFTSDELKRITSLRAGDESQAVTETPDLSNVDFTCSD